MSSILIKIGIFILAAGVIVLLVDAFAFDEHSQISRYIDDIFYGGAAVIAGGAGLWLVGKLFGIVAVRKCPRCGKPVERNEIYCATHLKQAVDEYKDQMHSMNRL